MFFIKFANKTVSFQPSNRALRAIVKILEKANR